MMMLSNSLQWPNKIGAQRKAAHPSPMGRRQWSAQRTALRSISTHVLSPGLDTLDVNPRRTLDVPSTYPRRQARTLDTIFCEDSLDRSLVLDI